MIKSNFHRDPGLIYQISKNPRYLLAFLSLSSLCMNCMWSNHLHLWISILYTEILLRVICTEQLRNARAQKYDTSWVFGISRRKYSTSSSTCARVILGDFGARENSRNRFALHINSPRSCWWRRWTDPETWRRWQGPGLPRPRGCRAAVARGRADTRRDEDAAASDDAAADRAVHFAPPLGRAAARRRPASCNPRCRRCRRPHCRRRRHHRHLRETTRAGTGAPGFSASAPRGSGSDSPTTSAPRESSAYSNTLKNVSRRNEKQCARLANESKSSLPAWLY